MIDPLCGIVIDDFKKRSPIGIHILSHFHSDHYQGLRAKWAGGIIFCSKDTRRLAMHCLGVPIELFRTLIIGTAVDVIEGVVRATAVCANHCPGAVMIILDTPHGRVLHTGDFRLSDDMRAVFFSLRGTIRWLWLDNTYCDPKYDHPPQDDVLAQTVGMVTAALGKAHNKVAVLVGTYTIGKERVALALWRAFGIQIQCLPQKYAILQNVEMFKLGAFVPYGTAPPGASVVLVPLGSVGYKSVQEAQNNGRMEFGDGIPALDFTPYEQVLCLKPTGWSRKISSRPLPGGKFHLVDLPYSEHSSFTELCETLSLLRPSHVVPFVSPPQFETHRKLLLAYDYPVQTTLDRFFFFKETDEA